MDPQGKLLNLNQTMMILYKDMHLTMLFAEWRPFCNNLNMEMVM